VAKDDYKRFSKLDFDDFRRMALDPELSKYEKIGFPDSYRQGKEDAIFQDIVSKLPPLDDTSKTVLDIGPGCSDLPRMLIDLCRRQQHTLVLIDSEEMLSRLPDDVFLRKHSAYFPYAGSLLDEFKGRIDVIISYSVFHYVFTESSPWVFLDSALSLLAPGGHFLIGDVPNISKRKRFFASERGIRFHQDFTGTRELPEVKFNSLDPGNIDDSVIMSLVFRARLQGFDAYVVPQRADLPMSNRREDILVTRP
jgi:SAM-dependent methyltransferase